MKKLSQQLESNFKAVSELNRTIAYAMTSDVWNDRSKKSASDQSAYIERLTNLKKRVLRIRGRLLENIQMEATKQLQHLSTIQRSMNLKSVA